MRLHFEVLFFAAVQSPGEAGQRLTKVWDQTMNQAIIYARCQLKMNVVRKTERITKKIQELLISAQEGKIER